MEERRSSPEEFLRRCENENQAKGRGSLKIFFGYAAGVGKTYSMLKAAHAARRRSGDDSRKGDPAWECGFARI